MSQSLQIRCQHCQSVIETDSSASKFWVRCGGCGRPVMPRDWGQIIHDPTPSVVFEPLTEINSQKLANGRTIPTLSAIRQALWKSRTARLQIGILILVAGFMGGISGGIYGGWYLFSDVFFSTIVSLTVAAMILLTPEIMITVASGSIASSFCLFTFGAYGRESQLILIYFLYGSCFSIAIQLVRYSILASYQKGLVNSAQEKSKTDVADIES